MISYQREYLSPALFVEAESLIRAHWESHERIKDLGFDLDEESYLAIESSQMSRLYTARLDRKLIGYVNFFLAPNLRSRGHINAVQDALYVSPEHRKGFTGVRLIEFAEAELRADNISVVYHHVGCANAGELLAHLGYEPVGTIHAKRIWR